MGGEDAADVFLEGRALGSKVHNLLTHLDVVDDRMRRDE